MSSISSVSSDSLAYLLQQLNQQSSEASKASESNSSQQVSFEEKFETTAQTAGLDVDALAELKDEIQSAVISAIENFDESQTSLSLDETIKNAIDSVLDENGFDADEVEDRLQVVMDTMQKSMPAGGPPPGGAPMGPPPEEASSTEEDESDSLITSIDSTESTEAASSTESMISMLLNASDNDVDFIRNLTGVLFGVDVEA